MTTHTTRAVHVPTIYTVLNEEKNQIKIVSLEENLAAFKNNPETNFKTLTTNGLNNL